MMRTAAAAVMTVLLGGCSLPNLNRALRSLPPAGTSGSSALTRPARAPRHRRRGPRSQVVPQLTMPPGAALGSVSTPISRIGW